MKPANILSIVQVAESVEPESFETFKEYCGIELKAHELVDLTKLVELLKNEGLKPIEFENFFVGYSIPQIGKEFDLLRFGPKCVVNIELKSSSSEQEIIKQLKKNLYYLKFIGKKVHLFTFESSTSTLFELNEDGTLISQNISVLAKLLKEQEIDETINADSLFDPSDYLVSPFNSTDRFLKAEYFLTQQQEEVKKKILDTISKKGQTSFVALKGTAGTGKTLLAYDIAKCLQDRGEKTLIIHCANLNQGQEQLKNEGWQIVAAKYANKYNLSKFDLIFIDEAQRIYADLLNDIAKKVLISNGKCLFGYDKTQTLSAWEEKAAASDKIEHLAKGNVHILSEKIRSNKEIANFIKSLLDSKRNFAFVNGDNINLRYFDNVDDAKIFLGRLSSDEWEVLRYTPSQYNAEPKDKYSATIWTSSHGVIGQEFDGIALVIDRYFKYDTQGKLIYVGDSYYSAVKMLFQNLTRARKRLLIVIIQNEELLRRCMVITRKTDN